MICVIGYDDVVCFVLRYEISVCCCVGVIFDVVSVEVDVFDFVVGKRFGVRER